MSRYPGRTRVSGNKRRHELGQSVDTKRLYSLLESLDLLPDNTVAKQALNEARAVRELIQLLDIDRAAKQVQNNLDSVSGLLENEIKELRDDSWFFDTRFKQALNEARAAREDLDATHIR